MPATMEGMEPVRMKPVRPPPAVRRARARAVVGGSWGGVRGGGERGWGGGVLGLGKGGKEGGEGGATDHFLGGGGVG